MTYVVLERELCVVLGVADAVVVSYVNSDLVIRIDAGLLILAAKMITQV